jgi:hypothetical protein
MFYKKEDVNEIITCQICSRVYDDPRILPCGETACHECIKSNGDWFLNCEFCKQVHQAPDKQGFPPNKQLAKLILTKADNVYRNEIADRLKEKLEKIKSKSDILELNLKNGNDEVYEHCVFLRNQVDLQTESVIEQVRKVNEKLRAEIDSYEAQCNASFKNNMMICDRDCNRLLTEVAEFHSTKSKYLTEFRIDEKVIKDSLVSVDFLFKRLENEEALLKKSKFDGRTMELNKHFPVIDSKLIGSLSFKEIGK